MVMSSVGMAATGGGGGGANTIGGNEGAYFSAIALGIPRFDRGLES